MHLLGVPVTGNYMIEFSENFTNDNGVPFACTYRGGLIFFDKNHRTPAKPKYCYIELARPQGQITFTVFGTKKNKSFGVLGTREINNTDTTATSDIGSELYSDMLYSDPADPPMVYAEASVIKRIKINKPVYNLEFEVTASSPDIVFTINQFMAAGRLVRTSDPSSFKN